MKFFTFFQFIPHSIAYFKYDSTPWENLAEFQTKILDIYWYSTFSDLFSTAITAKIFLSLLLAARWFESRRQQRRTLLATCDACSRLTERTSRCSLNGATGPTSCLEAESICASLEQHSCCVFLVKWQPIYTSWHPLNTVLTSFSINISDIT